MNKQILLVFSSIFFLGTFFGLAQDHKYGFRLGLNYSDIDFTEESILPGGTDGSRIGFMAGFFARYSLSEKISIQPEIQYSAQGEKSTSVIDNNGIEGQNSEDRLKINLLQVPVLFNYTVANKLTFSLGPQIGLRIWEWERKEDYETVQFSAIGGIGYNITDSFSVDLRASYGFTNAIDADNSNSFEVQNNLEPLFNAEGVNHYVQFSLAYSL